MVTRFAGLAVVIGLVLTLAWLLWPAKEAPSSNADQAPESSSRPAPREERRRPMPAPEKARTGGEDPCAHPFFPCVAGTRWVYDLRENGKPAGIMHVDLRRVASGQEGVRLHWRISIPEEGGAFAEVETLCQPGRWCEDPWFRLSNVGGVGEEGRRWEWPAELTVGLDFEGAIRIPLPLGPGEPVWAEMERRHAVEGVEEVNVGAGRFQSYRVAVTETQRVGEMREETHGRMWVAEGTGLVRALRVERGGTEREYLLAAVEDGP